MICSDKDFDFPLTVISKLLGRNWKGGEFKEVTLGGVKVKSKNFGSFEVMPFEQAYEYDIIQYYFKYFSYFEIKSQHLWLSLYSQQ